MQGLAPQWFDIEATVYAGDGGRTAARFLEEYCSRLRPTDLSPLLATAKSFVEHVPPVVRELYPAGDSASGTFTA